MKHYEDAYADTSKRDNGTSLHAGMDAYYRDGASKGELGLPLGSWQPREPKVANWVHDAIAWSEEHLEPRCESVHSEVYVAYNFSTGEVHHDPAVRERGYPDLPGYVPGTSDLVCILHTGQLLVADWKTGGGTGAEKQLLTLACGLREVYRTPEGELRKVVLAVLYAGEAGVRPHEWEVSDEELSEHKFHMQVQLMDVGVRTEAVPGPHCHSLYCGHLAHCPGVGAIVEDAAESPQGLLPAKQLVRKYDMSAELSSPAHAGFVMSRVTSAKRMLKYHETRVQRYLAAGGKVIADNLEYSKGNDGHRWRPKK